MTSDKETNVIELFGVRVAKAAEERYDDKDASGAIDPAAAAARIRKQAEDRARNNASVARSYRLKP